MNRFLLIVGIIGLLRSFSVLVRARSTLSRTTLTIAVDWTLAGLVVWSIAFGMCLVPSRIGPGMVDLTWYAAAVLMLCPWIAVLGAKRPGSRVWTWFILVPLLVVLGWPAMAAWHAAGPGAPVTFDEPILVGYSVVMLMGMGNYLVGRHFWAVTFVAIALIFVVAPLTAGVSERILDRSQARLWATVCLIGSIGLVHVQSKRRPVSPLGADRVWADFRDHFGIVWSKRILDRVNHTARTEHWPAELTASGFVWRQAGVSPELRTQTEARIEHTLRWLLRRFVDADWLDERIHANPRTGCPV